MGGVSEIVGISIAPKVVEKRQMLQSYERRQQLLLFYCGDDHATVDYEQ